MRVVIRQKNLEITPSLRAYIEQKIIRPVQSLLQKIKSPDLPILDVEVGRSTRHHRKGKVFYAEATLKLNGKLLRMEASEEDIRGALDILKEELGKTIKNYQTRAQSVMRRVARKVKRLSRYHPDARIRERGRMREEGI